MEVLLTDEIKDCIISTLSDSLTTEQSKILLAWLNESNDNKYFFDQIADIWHSSAVMAMNPDFDANEAWDDIYRKIKTSNHEAISNKKNANRLFAFNFLLLRSAAIWILMFALGGILAYLFAINQTEKQVAQGTIVIQAPLGSQSHVTLADGTDVWLNAGSNLKYSNQYGDEIREVSLEGEAYFKVAKNKNCPFIVKTANISITALGTAFNVKAYNDESLIETTLEEGSVKIESLVETKDKTSFKPVILKPNQKAVVSKNNALLSIEQKQTEPEKIEKSPVKLTDNKPVEVTQVPDVNVYTSWKDTRWIIRNESLESLIVKIERKYNVEITFKEEQLKGYVFSGTLEDETLEQVLDIIRLVAPIDYEINRNKVVLTKNKRFFKKYDNLMNN